MNRYIYGLSYNSPRLEDREVAVIANTLREANSLLISGISEAELNKLGSIELLETEVDIAYFGLDAMCEAAMSRIEVFIERSAAQHVHEMRKDWLVYRLMQRSSPIAPIDYESRGSAGWPVVASHGGNGSGSARYGHTF